MTTFDERERGFEAKFAHGEELRFLLIARRDRLFAQWAAGRLGLSEHESAELTRSVFALRDGKGHDSLLLQDVGKRLAENGSIVQAAELEAALSDCAAHAQQQLIDKPSGTQDAM